MIMALRFCVYILVPVPIDAATFKIGVVSPMTGANGATGQTFYKGLVWWKDKVNANGGIKTRDGESLVVELVLEDTQTNNTRAAEKVVDFYNGGVRNESGQSVWVDALVNTFTAHNIAINEAMAANNVKRVLMHCSGGTPAQYGNLDLGIPRWNYQFGVMIPSSTYATAVFRYVNKNKHMLNSTRVAFIKNNANPFTKYTCEESVLRGRENNLEIGDQWEFDGKANDENEALMDQWVAKLKADGTQILMGCTWLMDGLMLQKSIVKAKLDLAINIILIAPTNPKWAEEFPTVNGSSVGDYVLSPLQWHHTQAFNDDASVGGTRQFAEEYKVAMGSSPNYLLASCTAAGVFLEKALGKISWDPTSSGRDDMLQGMVRDLVEETVYGDVRFDRHNQNVGHPPAVIQILPGKGGTSVLPESNSESTINFPLPTWESRQPGGCPADRPVNNGYKCIICPSGNPDNVDLSGVHLQLPPACICRAGTFSKGTLSRPLPCEACSAGKFTPSLGATKCTQCPAGKFSKSPGAAECDACETGAYQPNEGQESCDACPGGNRQTTAQVGAATIKECICKAGFFHECEGSKCKIGTDDPRILDFCKSCGVGTQCEGPENNPSAMIIHEDGIQMHRGPFVEAGVMFINEKAYNCPGNKKACPGKRFIRGTIEEMCPEGGRGVGCALCAQDELHDGSFCKPCQDNIGNSIAVVAIVVVLLLLIVSLRSRPLEPYGTLTTITITRLFKKTMRHDILNIVLNFFQTMWIYTKMQMKMSDQGKETLGAIGYVFDLKLFKVGCAFDPKDRPASSTWFLNLAPLIPMAFLVMLYLIARIWGNQEATRRPCTWRALGTILAVPYVFFIPLANNAINTSFARLPHPGGESSLVAFPHLLADDPEADSVFAASIFGVLVWCCGTMAVYTAILYQMPRSKKQLFRLATLDITCKFKTEMPWWCLAILLQSLLVTIAPAVTPNAAAQYIWISAVVLVYLVCMLIFFPFSSSLVNNTEILSSCGKIATLFACAYYAMTLDGAALVVGTFSITLAALVVQLLYAWYVCWMAHDAPTSVSLLKQVQSGNANRIIASLPRNVVIEDMGIFGMTGEKHCANKWQSNQDIFGMASRQDGANRGDANQCIFVISSEQDGANREDASQDSNYNVSEYI